MNNLTSELFFTLFWEKKNITFYLSYIYETSLYCLFPYKIVSQTTTWWVWWWCRVFYSVVVESWIEFVMMLADTFIVTQGIHIQLPTQRPLQQLARQIFDPATMKEDRKLIKMFEMHCNVHLLCGCKKIN